MTRLRDASSPLFARRLSPTLKFGLFLAFSIAILFTDHQTEALKPVRSAYSAILMPVEWIAEWPSGISSISDYFASRSTLSEENERLQKEHLVLMARLQRLAALESENMRIRALLQSSKRVAEEVLIAEIQETSHDPDRKSVV